MQTIQLNIHKAQTTTPQRESCDEPQKSPIQLDIKTDEDLKDKINELFKDSLVGNLAKEFSEKRGMEASIEEQFLEDICQINQVDDTLKNKLYFLVYLIEDPNKLCQSGDSHDAEGIKDNIKIKEIQFLRNLIENPNKLERPIELLKNIANILIYCDSNKLVTIRSLNHVLATWNARRDLIEINMKKDEKNKQKEEENKRAKAALAKIEAVENQRCKEAGEAVRRAKQGCRDKERRLKELQKGFKELEAQNQELQAQNRVQKEEKEVIQSEFDHYMAKQIEKIDHEEKKERAKAEIERKKLEELRAKYEDKRIELENVEKKLWTLKPKAGQVPFLQRETLELQNQIMVLETKHKILEEQQVTVNTASDELKKGRKRLLEEIKILKGEIGDLECKQEEPKETTFRGLLRSGKKLLIDSIKEWANRDTLTWDERREKYSQLQRFCNWPQSKPVQTPNFKPFNLNDLRNWLKKFKKRPISVQEAYDIQAHHRKLCVQELTPQLLNETRPKEGVIACKFLRAQFFLMRQNQEWALQKRQADLKEKFKNSGVSEDHSAYGYIKNLDQCEPFELSPEAKDLRHPTKRNINGNWELAKMYVAGTLEDKTA